MGFLGEMETHHAWIDDRLPTEDDVNEHGHIIKPDRNSTKGWYPSDTQGMKLGDPWARILFMPIWVSKIKFPLNSSIPFDNPSTGNDEAVCHNCEPKIVNKEIAAELDDRAYEVGKFIHQLSKVQDDHFEELYKEAQMKGWVKGFGVDESGVDLGRDWLFDYCFNDFNQTFSEYCEARGVKRPLHD